MKILVLDDDKAVLATLRNMLTVMGHDVDCTLVARDAVGLVSKTHYDFIFVDYKMPENDGIWFMKNAKISKTTKVLLVTALVNRDVIREMFALGACGYMIKPFDYEEILFNLSYYNQKQNFGKEP